MNDWICLAMGWVGIYAPLALGAIGSMIGCNIAGQAAIGAMLETDSGYGRFLGVSAMPSSQTIYGIVIMFTLNRPVGPSTTPGLIGIGVLAGVALMYSAIYQGRACASAIQVAKAKPQVMGAALAPAAIIEGFAVFVFVFALVLSAALPGGTA